jgi:hypothetical protein
MRMDKSYTTTHHYTAFISIHFFMHYIHACTYTLDPNLPTSTLHTLCRVTWLLTLIEYGPAMVCTGMHTLTMVWLSWCLSLSLCMRKVRVLVLVCTVCVCVCVHVRMWSYRCIIHGHTLHCTTLPTCYLLFLAPKSIPRIHSETPDVGCVVLIDTIFSHTHTPMDNHRLSLSHTHTHLAPFPQLPTSSPSALKIV